MREEAGDKAVEAKYNCSADSRRVGAVEGRRIRVLRKWRVPPFRKNKRSVVAKSQTSARH